MTFYFFQQTYEEALITDNKSIKEFYEQPIKIFPATISYDDTVVYPAMTGEIAKGLPINNSAFAVYYSLRH